MTKEEAMFTINTLRRLPVALVLAGAVCALTLPQALAGGTSKNSPPAAVPDVVERYAAQHPFGRGVSPPPDVFERYAASHPYGNAAPTPQRVSIPLYTPAMLAAHYNREDRLYNPRPSLPQQAGVPLYTPAMLAAHYNREDLLYNPRPSLPTNPGPTVSSGFDWSDWAIGIGTGLGLALILGGGLLMGRHLRQRGIQTA
jgi:hypothetical protein